MRLAALIAVLVLVSAAPTTDAVTWTGRLSVWQPGAYSTQRADWSCVGATTQIMLNLVGGRPETSERRQFEYLQYAQDNSRYPVFDKGADPAGWAKALIRYGGGSGWGVSVSSSMTDALELAATQMADTGKPVGLLVKQGTHAWVMTGFEATADPASGADFEVTAAEVVGPLWPYGTLDGQPFDPGPRTWFTPRDLKDKFDAYQMPQSPGWNGRWIMVVPDAAALPAPDPSVPDPTAADLSDAETWGYVALWLGRLHMPPSAPF